MRGAIAPPLETLTGSKTSPQACWCFASRALPGLAGSGSEALPEMRRITCSTDSMSRGICFVGAFWPEGEDDRRPQETGSQNPKLHPGACTAQQYDSASRAEGKAHHGPQSLLCNKYDSKESRSMSICGWVGHCHRAGLRQVGQRQPRHHESGLHAQTEDVKHPWMVIFGTWQRCMHADYHLWQAQS